MYSKQKGFTLIELLVVIAIAAIMATIAFPNLSQWIASRRAASQAEQIANLLRFARSEAVRLNLPVYVCPVQIKSDGKSNGDCKSAYSGQGMLAFADKNNDKKYTNDTTDISLRSIILNGNQQSGQVEHSFKNISAQGKESKGNQFWVFFPNGMFAHSDSLSNINSSSVADGSVKIALTDAAAKDIATKRARASVVLIDNSGRVEICARPDSREISKYPDTNK